MRTRTRGHRERRTPRHPKDRGALRPEAPALPPLPGESDRKGGGENDYLVAYAWKHGMPMREVKLGGERQ